jgi:hypothetical protein
MEPSVTRMASPPAGLPTQGLPWQHASVQDPSLTVRLSRGDVGAQPKCHSQNPRQGEHSDQMGCHCDPKGQGMKASKSGVHNVQQPPAYWMSNDIFRYTINKLHSMAA